MLHQNIVKAVVRQWPGCLLNVDVNVGLTFGKIIGIYKAIALIKAAAEVELSHGKCACANARNSVSGRAEAVPGAQRS